MAGCRCPRRPGSPALSAPYEDPYEEARFMGEVVKDGLALPLFLAGTRKLERERVQKRCHPPSVHGCDLMLSSRLSPQTLCVGLNPLGESSAIQPPRFTRHRPTGEGLPMEKATSVPPSRPSLATSPRTPGTGQPSRSQPAATTPGAEKGLSPGSPDSV